MVLKKPVAQLVLVATLLRSFWGSQNGIQESRERLQRAVSVDNVSGMNNNNSSSSINATTSIPYTTAANLTQLQFRFENFEDGPHKCGAKKCVFQNKYDRRIGYLAVNSRTPKDKAYEFNLNVIEKEYDMKTVLLAPPHIVEVDDAFIAWAKSNRERGYTGQSGLARYNSNKLLVQPVEIVQKDESVLFGCEPPRFLSGIHLLEGVFNVNTTRGMDLDAVATNVASEFTKLYALLEDHTCLIDDFQIFLTRDGRLIHLDVDRCFEGNAYKAGERVKKKCLPFIRSFETIVLQQLHLLAQIQNTS